MSDFSIFIISKYILYDNIFDLSYYISSIIENANNVNTLALIGDTFHVNLYSILLYCSCGVIFALCFALFISIINEVINRIISLLKNKLRLNKYILIKL